MERRTFLSWVGLGLLASSLPVAIAACDPNGDPVTDSKVREDGFAVVGNVSELEDSGYLQDNQFMGESILVVRSPDDADQVVAVKSLCTHQGCTVTWNAAQTAFVCPCHGSEFAPDGSVITGPANQPLGSLEAKIDGDEVLVKAS
jgi:cytochrome b6-f complex iron-sulfur subunit